MSDWVEIERRIAEALKAGENTTMSTSQVSRRTRIHHQTAKKHLQLMEFHGIVESVTDGRITLWAIAKQS